MALLTLFVILFMFLVSVDALHVLSHVIHVFVLFWLLWHIGQTLIPLHHPVGVLLAASRAIPT